MIDTSNLAKDVVLMSSSPMPFSQISERSFPFSRVYQSLSCSVALGTRRRVGPSGADLLYNTMYPLASTILGKPQAGICRQQKRSLQEGNISSRDGRLN